MPKIVISYRRSDSSAIAGRIFDRLVAHYGEDSIFMDVDHIPFGIDFRAHIQETLLQADVLLAVIGPDWLGVNDASAARIRDKTDPVRVEIETAMARKMPIIPVLVDGAKMPDSAVLPAEFGNFAYLNAAEVATGRDFRTHMERLIGALDRTSPEGRKIGTPRSADAETQAEATAASAISARPGWLADGLRYFVVPLIVLLAAHHLIVNALDLNTAYLWAACTLVPLISGFGLYWLGGRGSGAAAAFAIALSLIGVTAMTISESLNSGDPIMPQTRVEWIDNAQFAGAIALSFFVGHALARALRSATKRTAAKLG
jgi:TIR domain